MIKYHPVTWIGIAGAAITLFAVFKDGLGLASWARRLLAEWQDWNAAIWAWVFDSAGIEPSPKIVPAVSFAAFIALLVIGINSPLRPEPSQPGNQTARRKKLILFLVGLVLYTGLTVGFVLAHEWLLMFESYLPQSMKNFDYLAVFIFPAAFSIFVVKERGSIILAWGLLFICAACLFVVPALIERYLSPYAISNPEYDEYDVLRDAWQTMVLIYLCQIGWMAVVLFTPIRPLIQGLALILTGLTILIGLGKLSALA